MTRWLFAASICCMIAYNAATTCGAPAPGMRVVGYFAEWTGQNAADLPGDRLTHINYAFALIKDGQIALDHREAAIERIYPQNSSDKPLQWHGHFGQLQRLREKYPHLKILISVGGWGGSEPFSDMAFTADSRSRFARSCALFVHQYGFNGIDIDWEYPGGGGANPARGRAEDRRNYTLLLAELRRQLTEQGRADQKQYLLTIATPASPKNCRCIELDKVHELVDFINLMTYDFTGSWSPVTGLNAPLFGPPPSTTSHTAPTDRPALSVDLAVRNYLAAGVPAQKLVLGVPFYGKAFGGVSDVNHGLFQPHGRQPAGPSGGGDWSYRNIKKQYLLTANPAIRFWDNLAKVPWIYDARSGVMVSYDDPISLRLKAQYAHEHKLGGVMIWELSQDDDQSSLLTALNTSP